ncbi:unnamed protein product (macronuclear) [Paramecium tetraurelia]|uniref:TNFR-Cys domain-containing protein n=1 Tax=Paramecium tetraurelia TaxID=5888 RepID=A0CAR7_PARTE|nr:uncharacterized protein GSPATT00036665001 [Paramecium tetraurelia]CAK67884.1 unnamed protein product [Paramecium tetraurelia]|eukprot:XP_001435281.1 hypothetical protein (macronuclear) [Paramecium tetraurelia strain d4-2]
MNSQNLSRLKMMIVISIILLQGLVQGCPFNDYENSLLSEYYPIQETIIEQMSPSQTFAFWSFSIPLWNVKSYPQVEWQATTDTRLYQLMFLLKSLDDDRVVMFMYAVLDEYENSVIHKLRVEELDSWGWPGFGTYSFEYDAKEYEGSWILTMITIQQTQVIFETSNYVTNNNIGDILLELNKVKFIIGGTGYIQIFTVGVFRGRLSKLMQFTDYSESKYEEVEANCQIPPLFEGEGGEMLFPELFTFKGDTQSIFSIDQVGKRFCISGWVKYDGIDAVETIYYLLLRLTTNQNYGNYLNMGDEILKITAQLNRINKQYSAYTVDSIHYAIPVKQQNVMPDPKIYAWIFIDEIPILYYDALTAWHYIQFEYGRTTGPKSLLNIKYFAGNLDKDTDSFGDDTHQGLFINTKYYAIFGDQRDRFAALRLPIIMMPIRSSLFNAIILVPLVMDHQKTTVLLVTEIKIEYQQKTNMNAHVILGILKKTKSVYHSVQSIQHQIITILFNILSNRHVNLDILCFQKQKAAFNGNLQINPYSPQQSSSDILCVDCLFNSAAWYLKPLCTTDYIKQHQLNNDDDAYQISLRSRIDYDLYVINEDDNLQLIQGAMDLCNPENAQEGCYQIPFQTHLSEDVYVACKDNHYYENNQCKFSDNACLLTSYDKPKCWKCKDGYYLSTDNQCELCPSTCLTCKIDDILKCLSCQPNYVPVGAECIKCGLNCSICQQQMNYSINQPFLKCLKCVDMNKYYLSLNAVDCIENTIENCQMAFEQAVDNNAINSFEYDFVPYDGEVITKCSKCDEPYCYNVLTMECELTEYPECSYCIYTPEDMFSWSCLFGPRTLDVIPDSSSDIGPDCFICMLGQTNVDISYLCLSCEEGFFANKITGQCEPCPADLFCSKCYQQNKYSKDEWKTEIRPFYKATIDDQFQRHSFIEYGTSPNKRDYEIVCSNCQSGYELQNDKCILQCPDNCLECVLIDNQNVCIKCPRTIKGQNLSLDNNQCIVCPINCSLCRKRSQEEKAAINPIFNSQEFQYSSNQCLRGFNGILDSTLGVYVDCSSPFCVKSVEINLNLFCDANKFSYAFLDQDSDEQRILFLQSNILIDELFSPSSFKEFETQQFYLMANQKVIQNISIKIVSQESQVCVVSGNKSIQQIFSQNIFSAINVELLIQGNGFTTFRYDRSISIVNFKNVKLEGIILNPIQTGNIKQLLFQSAFLQSIQLIHIKYDCSIQLDRSQIVIKNAQNVLIDEFESSNLSINNIDSFIKIEQINPDQIIQIQNIRLMQCQLKQTILLMLNTNAQAQVKIRNFQINSKFLSSQLLNIQSGSLIMDEISIQNSEVNQVTNLLQLESLTQIDFNQIQISQTSVITSTIFCLNQKAQITNLRFNANQLLKNSKVIQNQKVNVEQYNFELFIFELNTYDEDSKFIQIQQNLSPNKHILINDIQVIGNQLTSLSNIKQLEQQEITLIYLLLEQIEITSLKIERAQGIKEFSFIGINSLKINQATISQHAASLFQGLHQYIDCLTLQHYGTSIYIYDTTSIEFKSLTISTAESIDYPIINIQTSISQATNDNSILLSDLSLLNNLLLITDQMKQISLIQITTQQEFQINIIDSIFKKNIMHQYRQNDLINSGLLLNFDCSYCTINMDNVIAESNLVTNSTDGIIYIKAKKMTLKNSNFTSNSIFDYSIIQRYLVWGYNNGEEVFLEQIMEMFPIFVTTGNAKLISSDLKIQNVVISNSSGSGLYIRMENDAKLTIANSIFSFISTHFLSESENGGVIYLDSSNSVSTTIVIKNVAANNIYCGNRGGFVYLYNGIGTIQLTLLNTSFKDVFALFGSIIYSEFSALTSQSQNFRIAAAKINNTLDGQIKFFNKFSLGGQSQIKALTQSRFLILIYNAKTIQMENIVISDINFESFLFLQNTTAVQIKSIQVSRSNFLHRVMVLNDMKENSAVFINNLQIENVAILNEIDIESDCQRVQKKYNSQYKCLSQIKQSPTKLNQKYDSSSLSNAYCIINQMKQLFSKESLSIIDIHPSYTNMSISQVTLSQINCTICQNGLINVNFIDTHSFLLIQTLKLKQNICGQSSCVNVIKMTSVQRLLYNLESQVNDKQFELKINDYLCKYNEAYEGTCLQIKNIKTLIQKSIFEHNQAIASGGSIKVNGNDIFYLVQSLVSNNTAKYGGGLEIQDQMSQNMSRFGSIISNNKAQLFGNDSSQVPSSLSITINKIDILPRTTIVEQEQLMIEQILIKPYQVFANEFSDAFYVPNGQKISEYQYFDWVKGEYEPYNLHFRIVALDKLNSIQQDLDKTYCDISGRLLMESGENEFTQNFTNIKRVEFNQSDYNLDDLIIYLDDQLNMTLQLQFSCNSIFIPIYDQNKEIVSYHNNYYLRINIKTLPCQMGEIKSSVDSTCVPCDVEQGQFSLSVNSKTCLYKDDSTTSEIKSAQLRLKAGYWRPYFYTDQIDECINLIENCLGGWKEGDTSCYQGHIGALCEECDLYDIRGDGQFSTSTKYSCGSCTEKDKNSIIITAITLWTLISILISVKSTVELLKKVAIRVRLGQNRAFSNMQEDQSGVLIKMLTNHLQILATITTFQLNMSVGLGDAIKASGNPMQTMAFSLDCFLIDMFDFSIHYSRMVWQMILPMIYIFLFLSMYLILLKVKKQEYNLSVVTTTFIYMYIFLQPNLVGGFIQLISFRTISSYKWISANVAFRYDTWIHFKWLLGFVLPSFLVIAFLIPAIFFCAIYYNRKRLDDKSIRQQWGYLYNEYTHQAYFWEIVKIIEKELLLIFLSYYDEYVVKKGILVLLVIYIYQELNIKFKPYSSPNLNRLDSYSANVCIISIALGIGIYIDQQIGSLEIQIPYFIFLAVFNIYYLLLLLKELLKAYSKELEEQLDKARDLIRSKAPWTSNYAFLKRLLANSQEQRTRVNERFKKIKSTLMKQVKSLIQFKEAINKQQESDAVSLNVLDNQYNVFQQYKTANSLQNLKDEKLLKVEDNPNSNGQEKYDGKVHPMIIEAN